MCEKKIPPASGGEGPAERRKGTLLRKMPEDFEYEIKNLLMVIERIDDGGTEYSYFKIVAEALLFVLYRLKLVRTLFFIVFGCIVGHLIAQIF